MRHYLIILLFNLGFVDYVSVRIENFCYQNSASRALPHYQTILQPVV
jgi:hypothetical protein